MTDKIDFMMDSDPNTQRGLGLCLAKSVFNEGVALFAHCNVVELPTLR